jgi:hypothetical protein
MAGVIEVFRDDIQVVTERLVDKFDPPRFFPLLGQAQLHHYQWKCTMKRHTFRNSSPRQARLARPEA